MYGQQEVVKDLIRARLAADGPILFDASGVDTARHRDPRRPRSASRTTARTTELAVRLHRRLRRIPRRLPAVDSGRRALSVYERVYPFAWLGILAEGAADARGADLRVSRARLRALQHALAGDHPAVSAGRAGRGPRVLARRRDLGTSCIRGSRRTTAGSSIEGPVLEKSVTPMRSFVDGADAVRAVVPRRRRRAHRAADRRQRHEPRGGRRADARASASRILRQRPRGAAGRLLADVPRAHLARRAFLLVDDVDAAPVPRTTTASATACSARSSTTSTSSTAAATSLAENYVGLPFADA